MNQFVQKKHYVMFILGKSDDFSLFGFVNAVTRHKLEICAHSWKVTVVNTHVSPGRQTP